MISGSVSRETKGDPHNQHFSRRRAIRQLSQTIPERENQEKGKLPTYSSLLVQIK